MKQRVGVIGAGLGGLSAAVRLAARGYDVEMYEKNGGVGGKAGEVSRDGFRFDTGPSLLTMPFVVEELFSAAGKRMSDFLTVERLGIVCRYFFNDGSRFDAFSNEKELIESIQRFAPAEVDSYRRFARYSKTIYELTSDLFIFNRLHDLGSLLSRKGLRTLLRLGSIDPFRTVHQAVSGYFNDPRLVQLFDRYATYNGSSPFRAPATLNVIPHVELALGGYYLRGGIFSLSRALEDLARKLGVKIHFNAPVRRILMSNQRVTELELADGSKRGCDAIVSNADAVYTMTDLLPSERSAQATANIEPSSSGLVFLWGINGHHPELSHHNILFSNDYRKEFVELFDEQVPPGDPTVYVSITSRSDPDHAPPGCENWFVLINMPFLTESNRNVDVDAIRSRILARLLNHGIDVRGKILFEQMIGPQDFERRFNAHRGSIYGISSNSRRAAFLRPQNKVRDVKGLFLCGGASHPGGGMPLVVISGKLAAECCREYLA